MSLSLMFYLMVKQREGGVDLYGHSEGGWVLPHYCRNSGATGMSSGLVLEDP